jgi:radical SAM protein with 4Fe4S-binding SPASM domain
MCKQALGKEDFSNEYKDEMSVNDWKRCIDNIEKSFILHPRIHLTGGEPLLYTGAVELIRYAAQKHFAVSITTNGILLSKHAEALVRHGLRNLNVSVHGPQNVHDSVTGISGSFVQTMDAVRAVDKQKKEQNKTIPRICMNCVISSYNNEYLEQTIEAVQDSRADALSFQHLMFSHNDLSDASCQINVARLKSQIRKIRKCNYDIETIFYPNIKMRDLEAYYGDLSYDFGKVCVAPWFIMRIAPNGDVYPCLGHTCGNVRSDAACLRSIWNNPEFRNFRRRLKRGLFPECVRCCHRQYL